MADRRDARQEVDAIKAARIGKNAACLDLISQAHARAVQKAKEVMDAKTWAEAEAEARMPLLGGGHGASDNDGDEGGAACEAEPMDVCDSEREGGEGGEG